MPLCPICTTPNIPLLTSPSHCISPHPNPSTSKACSACWEIWLSLEVETQPSNQIRCMFCLSSLGSTPELLQAELRRLSHKATYERYIHLLPSPSTRQCIARCQGASSPSQPFTPGQIFTCTFCSSQVCTTCDRPTHPTETCSEYKSRFCSICSSPSHATQTCPVQHQQGKKFNHCPNCNIAFEIGKTCGYTQCISPTNPTYGCRHRFCSNCLVPWVGPNSVYIAGRLAHKDFCKHFFRTCAEVNGVEGCNRREHPGETCAEYKERLEPIQDAKERRVIAGKGEKHWETGHALGNRHVMTDTWVEREVARRERAREGRVKKKAGVEGGRMLLKAGEVVKGKGDGEVTSTTLEGDWQAESEDAEIEDKVEADDELGGVPVKREQEVEQENDEERGPKRMRIEGR